MNLGLTGKKAIVTGGTRGIGRAIVEELSTEGCQVGLCARDAAAVTATVQALERNGSRVVHGLTVKPDHGFAVRIHQTVFLCVFLHSFTC